MLVLLVTNVYGQDIYSSVPVVLPVSPQTTYTTAVGSVTNISSRQSVILGPGTTLSSGSAVIITVDPSLIPPPPSNPANDNDKNWVLTRTYDENGKEITIAKAFFDKNGKNIQTQVKNESTGHVLASQPLYDLQGRAVGNTLAAPTNNSAFAYKDQFISRNNVAYSYLNFDGDPASTTNPYARVNSPDPVDNSQQGTLGWYYSNNNTLEPYVAATGYPYARTEYYHDGTGSVKRSAGVSEQLKLGAGHETGSNSFPVQNELNNYLAIRNKFFPAAVSGAVPSSLAGQALQSVSTDENGLSTLSVTDLSGNQSLMTARAETGTDSAVDPWLLVQNTVVISNIRQQYSYSITIAGPSSIQGNPHDPAIIAMLHALKTSFSVNSAYPITVTCISGGVATWTGTGNDYRSPSPPLTGGSYSFTITSDYAFSISASGPYGVLLDQYPATFSEPDHTSIAYFQQTASSPVTYTGNAVVYDMKEEGPVTSFTSGNILPAGYYKVVATTPTDNTTNNVTVTYTNKYSDITYNYYNQLGQLIGSIAPNGVQKLIQSGYTSYTTAAELPFVSLYEYDLQGRLTAATITDGGRSEYVYRRDGKIRFSQNAVQKVAANAGTGNIEKFSYTNYDTFGRPIESGEYLVPTGAALTFASTKTNTTLQEKTGEDDGLTGGTKQSRVNTYYDLPAANLAPSGYTQDPGFLKGAVSYTTNASSTTWYNYDDYGRITWTVKQILGLPGYKTVNYTYNEQGNTSIVDYQKEIASEHFVHYYTYDADGRLVNVKTSADGGTTKLQQAAYQYYLHGPLKRVELADKLQGIDYVYTTQGLLKSINHPSGDNVKDPGKDGTNNFSPDAFGMQIEYFPNDYSRTGSNISSIPTGQPNYYNGNVNGISWQSKKPSSILGLPGNSGIQNPTMYTYGYDNKYQLNAAIWGTPNFNTPAFTAGAMFKENGITYDANGNINGLQRTNNAGALSDDFSKYTYEANTNKLTTVGNTAGTNNYATYTYDELGQLKSQNLVAGNISTYLKYDVTGKITGIYSDAALTIPKVTYTYDESGNRIKTVNTNSTTYYVYDATGNVMAIYTGTTITELPVYGANRLGTYFASGNNYYYELRDNVGSVKVVVNRTKVAGQADVLQYSDYYPYGSIARNGGVGYRYEYQGAFAEKDPVTGYNNFELRMYDGRIGRWLSIDPAGQFASPYEAMGNNPVIRFDMRGDTVLMQNLPNGDLNGGELSQANVVSSRLSFGELHTRELYGGANINWANQPDYIQRQYANYNEGYARQHKGVAERDNAMALNIGIFVLTDGVGELVGPAIYAWGGRLIGRFATTEGIAASKAAGILGEDAVGISGSKTAINVGGRTRIPDRLTANFLEEVKNVKYQSLTSQLRDFNIYSQQNNLQMILHTRSNTILSKPLQGLIDNGSIIHKIIPGL